MDADLLWFYMRTNGLRVTDLIQGPVYRLSRLECEGNLRLRTNSHYDDIFGTVVNRFLVRAVAGVQLTVDEKGGQTHGCLNPKNTSQCVRVATETPAATGELRVVNQFTEQFTAIELADRVKQVGTALGLPVETQSIPSPRKGKEDHYDNAKHSGCLEFGLEPYYMNDDMLAAIPETIIQYKASVDPKKIMPRARWS